MVDQIISWLTEVGTVTRVYTEVDYYTYIKTVEYLICIGFFVVYNLFWKKIFKPDHWAAKYGRVNLVVAAFLTAGLLFLPLAGQAASASPPDSVTIDPLASLYGPVEFDHATHVDLAEGCASCHHHTAGSEILDKRCTPCHATGSASSTASCKGCHAAQPFTSEELATREADKARHHLDKPGLKGAYHLQCTGCHLEMGGPTGCEDCHSMTAEGKAFYRKDVVKKEKEGEKP